MKVGACDAANAKLCGEGTRCAMSARLDLLIYRFFECTSFYKLLTQESLVNAAHQLTTSP